MYETILLVGFMMLNNIPSDDYMDDWEADEQLEEWRGIDDPAGWDVTIGARDGIYFHLYYGYCRCISSILFLPISSRIGSITRL
jgi:hypothetical protein